MEVGREASVHAEDAFVDDGGDGEEVEHGAEVPPEREGVSSFALVVEAVHSGDGGALMVASQQVDHVGVLHLVGQQQTQSLDALLAPIHEVSNQHEFVLRRPTTHNVEKPQQIIKLPVEVARDLDGPLQLQEHGLLSEDGLDLLYEPLHGLLLDVDVGAHSLLLGRGQLVN